MGLKLNFDPAPWKAIIIGVLLFFEAIVSPAIIILQQGTMPTTIQMLTIILVAALQLITYFLVFLGYKPAET
jgi:hypothetical protein